MAKSKKIVSPAESVYPSILEEPEEKSLAETIATAPKNETAQEKAITAPVFLSSAAASLREESFSATKLPHLLNKIFINASRVVLGGLLIFEVSNWLGVFHEHITYSWPGLLLTAAGIWFLLEAILSYTRQDLKQGVFGFLMFLAAAAVFTDAMGDVYSLFDKIEWYDQVLHFFAGGVTCGGIIFYVIKNLQDREKIRLGYFSIGFFSWMTAVFFGALYELLEYMMDLLTGSNSLVSAFDTANDLFLDVIGSLLIAAILSFSLYYASRRSHPLNETAQK